MSQIESLSQIEEKLNNLSLKAKNNIDNANTHEELDQLRVSLLGKDYLVFPQFDLMIQSDSLI